MHEFFEDNTKPTPCQCNFVEGQDTIFCDRHQCSKTKHLYSLCQKKQAYFDLWEKGEGPLQNNFNQNFEKTGPIRVSREKREPEKGFFETEEAPQRSVGFFETDDEEHFMGDKNIPKKSTGLGDTIAKFAKVTGIDKLVKSVVGEDCGCTERQSKLNRIFPYKGRKKTKGFFE